MQSSSAKCTQAASTSLRSQEQTGDLKLRHRLCLALNMFTSVAGTVTLQPSYVP